MKNICLFFIVFVFKLEIDNPIGRHSPGLLGGFGWFPIEAAWVKVDFRELNLPFSQFLVPYEGFGSWVVNFVFGRHLQYTSEYLLYWVALLKDSLQEHDFCLQGHLSVLVSFFPYHLWHYIKVNKFHPYSLFIWSGSRLPFFISSLLLSNWIFLMCLRPFLSHHSLIDFLVIPFMAMA